MKALKRKGGAKDRETRAAPTDMTWGAIIRKRGGKKGENGDAVGEIGNRTVETGKMLLQRILNRPAAPKNSGD